MTDTPSPEQISRALASLSEARDARQRLTRALHLALPVTEAVSIAVEREPDALTWRGVRVAIDDDDALVAHSLAVAGRCDEDHFLDLEQPSAYWVKVIRSGARRHLFGAQLLFGLGEISLDDGVDEGVAADVVAWALSGAEPPGVVGDALVDGTPQRWIVRSSALPVDGVGPAPVSLEQIAETVRRELGGSDVEIVDFGDVHGRGREAELIVDRPDAELVVPVVLEGPGAVVGVSGEAMVVTEATPPWRLDGFDVLGASRQGDGVVMRHHASGYRVLVTRRIEPAD